MKQEKIWHSYLIYLINIQNYLPSISITDVLIFIIGAMCCGGLLTVLYLDHLASEELTIICADETQQEKCERIKQRRRTNMFMQMQQMNY